MADEVVHLVNSTHGYACGKEDIRALGFRAHGLQGDISAG